MNETGESQKLKPRNQCRDYMARNDAEIVALLTLEEFDGHAKVENFLDGPYIDSFEDGHGELYNPNRQAFGKLKEEYGYESDKGIVKFVFCELGERFSKDLSKKVRACITNQGRLISLIQENKFEEEK